MTTTRLDDLQDRYATPPVPSNLTLLPDPEPQELWCPIISVDDHVLEPPTLFDRLPAKLRTRGPRIIDVGGLPAWEVDERRFFLGGTNGAVGRPQREAHQSAMRFDQFRPGVWDADARIRDMDVNGMWASLNFGSVIWGFAGKVLASLGDPELAQACVRAYNDWVVEEWCGAYPDRLIPCQMPYLADPVVAAEEVRRNAARGVHAVSFSENPAGLGLPSMHSDYWDPFLAACAETGTVVNLHVGSSGTVARPAEDSPVPVIVALFPMSGMSAMIDWVFSKIPIRFPDIKIALSEGGVSWVPTALERLQRAFDRRDENDVWSATDPHPIDLVRRNFWFTSIEDPSAFRLLELIGEDRVMVEVDYPHADSSWPHTQDLIRRDLSHLPASTIAKVCYKNAAALYQHPLPPDSLIARASAFAVSAPQKENVAW
ncbi:amidohydrolase family protein [Mycolicibacterium stellerae]|uniref:amidohydrolase family protein n=1 Tax=Mycolicibacterium stellerae TaxID=2358193 RepID=UPI001F17E5A6|nr:amidohydrolase family protein [Mycolicibacterium stellerae]